MVLGKTRQELLRPLPHKIPSKVAKCNNPVIFHKKTGLFARLFPFHACIVRFKEYRPLYYFSVTDSSIFEPVIESRAQGSIISKASLMEAFVKCSGCNKILYNAEFEQNLFVCPHCGKHHRLNARQRIAITFDEGSFLEHDADLRSENPLQFPEYSEKLHSAEAKTGTFDSVISGTAKLDGQPVSMAVADFSFMGGSMGSVAGEKITRALERAVEQRIPCIIFAASGGARMQEGLLSLMQMAKTTAACGRCNETGTPYICVFTDPTMAGVLASYASVADVIIAEPKALIGFAGARVSKQAQVSKVPDGFQTAEFLFEKGMIDRVVPRKEMRGTLSSLVKLLGAGVPA